MVSKGSENVRESELQPLEYASPPEDPPMGGVHVADYGDRLVITGPQPRPLKVIPIVFWGALAAVQVGWIAYSTGRRLRGWRFGADVVFFVLLCVGVWCYQLMCMWRGRRPRVTEITRAGVSVTNPAALREFAWYPRREIRCMNLVHGEQNSDGLPTCTLRLVLRGGWAGAFGDARGRVILSGPAAQLREIGDRVRQVLDG